ncbi:WD40 repeat-like protein [Rhizoclosmatium globosum]|uniref:Katanin p80 WD40 repeat-containing subunit B1 homolog n=1 Tax=Rhizoclosmatium globosum TaxID=329046 RepID=A0A1Y2CRI7_9FUNG|nr:WD40 repeat-like protein [Rhizoclosmatium globosum]|eukprot:ORY49603.1 WD40 repeat-like protein [Rhizoclosmatium globosum]
MSAPGAVAAKIHDVYHASASHATCLRIGPKSGKVMVSGSEDGIVSLWALGRTSPVLTLPGHASSITALAIDCLEDYTVVGCASGPIKLWDLQQAKVARTLSGAHREATTAIEYHPFGDFFVSGGTEAVVKVWDVKKKASIQTYSSVKGGGGAVEVIRVTPDGRWIASGWEDGSVKIWDMTAGKLLKTFTDSATPVVCITFSPFEFIMAVGYTDGRVWFYDLESFTVLSATDVLKTVPKCVEFHKGGKEVIIACQDSIQVWSWDPLVRHDAVAVNWPNIAEIRSLEDNKLVGASLDQNMVGIWGIKVDRLKPYKTTLHPNSHEPPPETHVAPPAPPSKAEPPLSAPPKSVLEAQPNIPSRNITPSASRDNLAQHQRETSAPRPNSVQRIQPMSQPPITKRSSFVGTSGGETPLNLDITKFTQTGKKRVSPVMQHASASGSGSTTPDALSPTSENELLTALGLRNASMTSILRERLSVLQEIRAVWDETNVRPAVERMVECRNSGVWIDMLRLMNRRAKVFTLDVAILLLPLLNELLFEVYEDYIVEACNTIKLLCKSFGPLILQQLGNSFSSPGIDISREDRQRKCVLCYQKLKDIQLTLSDLTRSAGRVGASVRETLVELEFLG